MPKIDCRYVVVRGGIPLLELAGTDGAAVSFQGDADIKMTFSGVFDNIPDEVNFLTDRLAVYEAIDGVEYPLGVYVITTPTVEKNGSLRQYQLTGYDLTYLAQLSKVEERPYYAKGTPYTTVIRNLLVESGIVDIELEANDATLLTDRQDWEPGTDRMTIVNDLLSEINYRTVYMDLDGIVRAKPWTPPTLGNVRHSYLTNDASILLPGATLGRDTFSLANVFIREVDNPDLGETLRAVAENTDAASPISIQNRNMRVVDYEKIDNVASQAELQSMVDNLRLKSYYSTETVSFETGPAPTHGAWDVVRLQHGADTGIFEETAWNLTLGYAGTMTHEGRRATWL